MGCALFGSTPPFIINLGGVTWRLPRSSWTLRRSTPASRSRVALVRRECVASPFPFFHSPWIAFPHSPAMTRYMLVRSRASHRLLAVRRAPGPEDGAGLESGLLGYSDIASAPAKWIPIVRCLLPFFVDRQGHMLTVLVKVLHPQPAGSRQPHRGVEIGL